MSDVVWALKSNWSYKLAIFPKHVTTGVKSFVLRSFMSSRAASRDLRVGKKE